MTARGKLPIVCGGTFLWVRALIYGLAKTPPASEEDARASSCIDASRRPRRRYTRRWRASTPKPPRACHRTTSCASAARSKCSS
ncbi:MAG: hypothetical protein QM756_20800 [Polyangiaceae bacterium]